MAEQRVTAWDGLDGTDCRFCGTSYEACSAGVVRDRNDPQASDGCCTDCLDASGHEVSPHVLMSWNGEVEMDSGTEDKVAIHRQRPAGDPITPPPNPLLAATGSYIDRGEAEPEVGQRVTDEQLTEWTVGNDWPLESLNRAQQAALIADLRASRAREAELAAEVHRLREIVNQQKAAPEYRALQRHLANERRSSKRYHRERDGLQQRLAELEQRDFALHAEIALLRQRIDKALTELGGVSYGMAGRVRAALTGTDTPSLTGSAPIPTRPT